LPLVLLKVQLVFSLVLPKIPTDVIFLTDNGGVVSHIGETVKQIFKLFLVLALVFASVRVPTPTLVWRAVSCSVLVEQLGTPGILLRSGVLRSCFGLPSGVLLHAFPLFLLGVGESTGVSVGLQACVRAVRAGMVASIGVLGILIVT